MNYTQIKQVKSFCDSLFSTPDWREVVNHIEQNDNDFTVDDVRFINENDIRGILEDELAGDEYVLGCFAAWAIADATGWPLALIEAVQKGDQFEAIGKAMTGEHIANLAQSLVQHDGYGHHFNRHDFSEEEFKLGEDSFLVFDNH